MNELNTNQKEKRKKLTASQRARIAGAAVVAAVSGTALAINMNNNDTPVRDSNPITTEAPSQTTVETVKSPETITDDFMPKVAAFVEALNSDTSGAINKVQLAPNAPYEGKGPFTQFSYITERGGMLLSVNVISESDNNQNNPALDTIAEFSAQLTTPGAVPPTDENPTGDLVVSSVRFDTNEGTHIAQGTSDQSEFRVLENKDGQELSQPDGINQINLLIESMEQFAIPE